MSTSTSRSWPRLKLHQAASNLHRRRWRRNPGRRQLHFVEGGVHAAQRADRGGSVEARLPRQGHSQQRQRHAEGRHAGRRPRFPSSKAMPVISFDRVSKRYGHTNAVRELSLSIERGEMFGLIGPDGAGKTTTIRLMCGLLPRDGGSIRVLDLDPVQRPSPDDGVGRVPLSQRFSLCGDLSIDENIAFFAEIHGVRDYRARRDRLLEMTQLTPFRTRLADRLSGGMKQKLALACTLVHEPAPDRARRSRRPASTRFRAASSGSLLSEFLAQGITIVMATPYLD